MILEFEHVTGIGRGHVGKSSVAAGDESGRLVSKDFVLQDISFTLEPGYIMGLAGKNGAGKSTIFDYILNPQTHYSGVIRIDGEDVRKNHSAMMNKIGFISDNNHFITDRTAEQNVQILGMLYAEWDDEIFGSAMKKMELSVKKTIGKMSRGELFKFQTAFAMAHKPCLYLIDEATAGMDPVFRIDYFKMLQEIIRDETASVIMTSHIQDEIARKMDYVGIMEAGKLVQFGASMDVFHEESIGE